MCAVPSNEGSSQHKTPMQSQLLVPLLHQGAGLENLRHPGLPKHSQLLSFSLAQPHRGLQRPCSDYSFLVHWNMSLLEVMALGIFASSSPYQS
jgi:hypothetical protein